jgi:hypothetical protein
MGKRELTPVVRPDINGKLVTRHVIVDKAVDSAGSLPMPVSGPRLMGAKEYARRIAQELVRESPDQSFRPWALTRDQRMTSLTSLYGDSLAVYELKELYDRMDNFTDQEKDMFEDQVPALLNDLIVQSVNQDDREKIFHGILTNTDLFTTFHPVSFGSEYLLKSGQSAVRDARALGIDPRSGSEAEHKLYRFLLYKGLVKDDSFMDVMETHEKAYWFSDNEHLLFPHADAIMKRHGDWEWMNELVNPDTAPSLSEGTL